MAFNGGGDSSRGCGRISNSDWMVMIVMVEKLNVVMIVIVVVSKSYGYCCGSVGSSWL